MMQITVGPYLALQHLLATDRWAEIVPELDLVNIIGGYGDIRMHLAAHGEFTMSTMTQAKHH